MTANLTDVQEVQITIPNAITFGTVIVTHNLEDADGNDLTPDTVTREIVFSVGAGAMSSAGAFLISRSSPEDGTYSMRLWGNNNSGVTWIYTIRVTSEWKHSIQSRDHTV